MADSMNVHIEGLDDLLKKMNRVADGDYIKKPLQAGGERVRDKAGKYPPSGDWNSPQARSWYERNWGSKWRTKDGAVHGKKTSEKLGKKGASQAGSNWYVKPDNMKVTVGNKVSYASYVHGDKLQTKFHADHGWKKLGETAKEQAENIVKDIRAAFVQMWKQGH